MSFLQNNLKCICHQPNNNALLDNTKYIIPCDKVYFKTFTPMLEYPGNENNSKIPFDNYIRPEEIKAMNIKSCKSCIKF